jgi:CMP-N-acetylneuraminic acid synthetase
VYRPNGALYGSWTTKLKQNKNYYKGLTKGYFMPRNRSIDIDTQFEFDLAEFILKSNV